MCYYASQLQKSTNYLKDIINHEIEHMKSLSGNRDETYNGVKKAVTDRKINLVQDPTRTAPKGDKRNKNIKKCGNFG